MLETLNNLHPALRFTCEHEEDGQLPFLDVLVLKTDHDVVDTAVYRKPTFTGLYIPWDSYCATKYKVNLVKTLVLRARRICSGSRLPSELDKLREMFVKNGYPMDLLARLIRPGTDIQKELEYGPRRCTLYLRLPWKGQSSSSTARAIVSAVRSAYFAVNLNVVYSTTHAFNLRKDTLPSPERSHIIYEFECRNCGSRYVGRTFQKLSMRIRQHVPLHLLTPDARASRPTRGRPRMTQANICEKVKSGEDGRRRVCPPRKCKKDTNAAAKKTSGDPHQLGSIEEKIASEMYQSAIARHLAENDGCRSNYDDSCFHILSSSQSKRGLEVLEALFIKSKQPDLCIQKCSVTTLKLFSAVCH